MKSDPTDWTIKWLSSVTTGASTMSQRKLTAIEKRGGGLAAVTKAARQNGVHLVLLEDDKGDQLVAASMKPFKTLC